MIGKRTKIVATLGPASSSTEVIEKLIKAGTNVFRLNFSHGAHEGHLQVIQAIRKAAENTRAYIAILGDLCGPKIRVGRFAEGPVELKPGDKFFLSENPDEPGTIRGIGTSYPHLTKDIKPGNVVLLDDGNISLKALAINGDCVDFEVLDGGLLKDKKGLNMPGIKLSVETITEKDRADLKFMIENDLDFVALSFVRSGKDVKDLKKMIGDAAIKVIAKIEKPEALNDLEKILDECEGIMIARGDLGVEVPIQQVPSIQRHLLQRCSRRGKSVITATQMLESMIENQRPTRAETTDVFNAIVDGSDAVMLSGETAVGRNPVEAVQMMAAIAVEAEKVNCQTHDRLNNILPEVSRNIEEIVAHSACEAALDASARAIIPFTRSGNTALHISKYHPPTPVIALTPKIETCRRLALSWGVTPILVDDLHSTDEMMAMAEKTLKERKIVEADDIIVIVAGVPIGVKGSTNLMKLHKIK
ncbi:MAG: Pyruvate kinase [Candidatus Rifleibacterium amylolyticum]|nr:MAG: Pyruvate kinase [Candidatus Rifleibacterium amylolyticum]